MYTYRKTALRAYSYGVVAEFHRASRTPRAIEIYIGIDPGESNFAIEGCGSASIYCILRK
jgi:hypothetical protein